MEAVSISETSIHFYQSARRNIPEDSHSLVIIWLILVGKGGRSSLVHVKVLHPHSVARKM
jgi:hypothetical protein